MTRKSVTDEQFGQLHRRTLELERRVDEGALAFDGTMIRLQRLIEGREEWLERCLHDPAPTLEVRYDIPIQTRIKGIADRRRVDYISGLLTSEYFPCPVGCVLATRRFEFVNFKSPRPLFQAKQELLKVGLRGPTVHELVAYEDRMCDMIHYYPIPALESVYRDPGFCEFVPVATHGVNSWIFDVMHGMATSASRYLVTRTESAPS